MEIHRRLKISRPRGLRVRVSPDAQAFVMKLVDVGDLKFPARKERVGSSPTKGTKIRISGGNGNTLWFKKPAP